MFEAIRLLGNPKSAMPEAASYVTFTKPLCKLDPSAKIGAPQGVWRVCALDQRDMSEAIRLLGNPKSAMPEAVSYVTIMKPLCKLDPSAKIGAPQGVWRVCASDRRDMFKTTRLRSKPGRTAPEAAAYASSRKPLSGLDSSVKLGASQGV